MVNLSAFAPDVVAVDSRCPGFVAEKAVLAAAIEFAEMTWCLQSEHDPFDLDAGVDEYELDSPASHKITGIINVRINGRAIDSATVVEKDRNKSQWRTETAQYPDFYLRDTSKTISTIKLYPLPIADVDDAVNVLMAIKPSTTATRIADEFADNYRDAIIAGAISRIMLQPGQVWSHLEIASGYRAIFLDYAGSSRNNIFINVMQPRENARIF